MALPLNQHQPYKSNMKRPISKADIRKDIDKQVIDFLKKGGEVAPIQRGLSGRINPDGPIKTDLIDTKQPKEGRTYVPEVIAAMDARRNVKATPPKAKSQQSRRRKKVIYDDFGEPLREIWVDE